MGKSKNVMSEINRLERRIDELEAEIAVLHRQVEALINGYGKPGPSETKILDNVSWTGEQLGGGDE